MLSDRRLFCLSVTLVYCGQTVEWIKMPLGTEVGLGPGHILLDGDPAPLRKGAQNPSPLLSRFTDAARKPRPMSIAARQLDGSGYRYGGRPRTCDIVLDGEPAPHEKGHSSPHFSAHFALARSVAHLSNC